MYRLQDVFPDTSTISISGLKKNRRIVSFDDFKWQTMVTYTDQRIGDLRIRFPT